MVWFRGRVFVFTEWQFHLPALFEYFVNHRHGVIHPQVEILPGHPV
jgi:hypothetical protein